MKLQMFYKFNSRVADPDGVQPDPILRKKPGFRSGRKKTDTNAF